MINQIKSRSIDILYKLLPFVFLIHNLEETIWVARMQEFSMNTPDLDTDVFAFQFRIAVFIFTVLGFVLAFGFQKSRYYDLLMNGFAGALFLNVFFPHTVASVYYLSYLPGLVSGLLLVLPLTFLILQRNFKNTRINKCSFFVSIIVGALTGIVLIIGLLYLGNRLAESIIHKI